MEWFLKVAEQGLADAQCELGYMYANLGYIYDNGTGVERSYEKARVWFQKAAEQGDEHAIKELDRLNGRW